MLVFFASKILQDFLFFNLLSLGFDPGTLYYFLKLGKGFSDNLVRSLAVVFDLDLEVFFHFLLEALWDLPLYMIFFGKPEPPLLLDLPKMPLGPAK